MVRPHRSNAGGLTIVVTSAVVCSSLAAADPAAAPPAGSPESERVQRPVGAMISGSVGLGSSAIELDLWMGMLVHPHIALFGEAMGLAAAGGGDRFLGGGVRVSSDWAFLDARFGRIRASFSCDFDDPCTTRTATAGILGSGIEVLHGTHAGLEIHVDLIEAFHDSTLEAGLGVSFYP